VNHLFSEEVAFHLSGKVNVRFRGNAHPDSSAALLKSSSLVPRKIRKFISSCSSQKLRSLARHVVVLAPFLRATPWPAGWNTALFQCGYESKILDRMNSLPN
jgi:hypothetical protein